jgi:hypothetical protein
MYISGGNNALRYMHHLEESVRNVGEALLVLGKIKKKFEKVRRRKKMKSIFSLGILGLCRYVKTNNSTETSSYNMYYLQSTF